MGESVDEEFEKSRPRLRAIAKRVLGSETEADDAVQEAWLRLTRTGPESIDNLGGWLTTVVSRVCLDMLRSRRREELSGADLPEDATDIDDDPEPESDVLLADSLSPALLLVLDSLEPVERLAFVLHDLFGMPFGEIAPIVGRSSTATRQLASRARRRLQGQSHSVASSASTSKSRQSELVQAFLAASREGDFEALLAVLDPEVVLRSDPVAVRSAGARRAQGAPPLQEEIRGCDAVARVFVGRSAEARSALVNGVPGAVWAPEGQPRAAFVMQWSEDRIIEIEVVFDPRRLRTLDLVL